MTGKNILVIAIYILAVSGVFYIVRCSCASSSLAKGNYLVSCSKCECLYKVGSDQISLFQRGGQMACPLCPECKLKE